MIEYRTVDIALEPGDKDSMKVGGYAARFNVPSLPLMIRGRQMREQIDPAAFDNSLNDPDISLYWQHDNSQPLATTLSGSLNMRTDEEGLIFDALLADTTLGRDAMELLRRGMVRQMSFGFTVREDKFDGDLRTLLDVDLAEISLVERAAYPQTNADARALSRSHLVTTQRIALRIKNLKGKL